LESKRFALSGVAAKKLSEGTEHGWQVVMDAHFEAAQNAAQYTPATPSTASQDEQATAESFAKSDMSRVLVIQGVGDTRLELVTSTV
jgi:hypothetical protein